MTDPRNRPIDPTLVHTSMGWTDGHEGTHIRFSQSPEYVKAYADGETARGLYDGFHGLRAPYRTRVLSHYHKAYERGVKRREAEVSQAQTEAFNSLEEGVAAIRQLTEELHEHCKAAYSDRSVYGRLQALHDALNTMRRGLGHAIDNSCDAGCSEPPRLVEWEVLAGRLKAEVTRMAVEKSRHCGNDPSTVGCCGGTDVTCSCECNTCENPNS